jgi:hypothetical protein
MIRARFRRSETEALVGKRFETLVKLSNVPKGTRGRVVKVEHPTGSNILILVIDWELEESMQTKTVRDALTLSRYEIGRLLQEV